MIDDKQKRRQFSSEDKAKAVKRHVLGGETLSAVCENLGIAPNMFYRWQKELFHHAAAAFEVKGRGKRPHGKTRMYTTEMPAYRPRSPAPVGRIHRPL